MNPVIHGTDDLPQPNATLPEVIAWAKRHRALMSQSQLGIAILKAIDAKDMKRLKKFWRGRK